MDGHHHGIRCSYCNCYGHIGADCRIKAREKRRQPRAAVVVQQDTTKDVIISTINYNDFLQFKASHQPSSFATVAQSSNPVAFVSTSSLDPWVLDFGASDHMTGNKSILSHLSYSDYLPSVTVEDGSKIKVHDLDQAHPLPNFSLEFVLYVPGCLFNLIYVHKLTHTLDCSVLFNDKLVYVWDRRT